MDGWRRQVVVLAGVSAAAAAVIAAAGCRGSATPAGSASERGGATVRLAFAGDVMLGRGVATLTSPDPAGPLAGIRFQIGAADLAVANLESPLTLRRHDPASGPNALEASPAAAGQLAAAGFDAMAIANNHAGDAGPATVTDTVAALDAGGLAVVGGGVSAAAAFEPTLVRTGGLVVALLAFDATGVGPRAGAGAAGVAWWEQVRARRAVERARASADIVAVAVHGGSEYVSLTDPYLLRIGRQLAGWGADVVWGHGPHVVQPVQVVDPDGDGRPTVVATSLGNLLFDQHLPHTRDGAILEVVAGANGVRTWRVGVTEHRDGPVHFERWLSPAGDAVWLDGAWSMLARPVVPAPSTRPPAFGRFPGDPVDGALADVDGDGWPELVVAFRRPFSETRVGALLPDGTLVDRRGRSAHVGLYRPLGLRPEWVAGTLVRPVARLAACDGVLAVAYSGLDDTAVTATGAWQWSGFGFVTLPDLPGPGVPACADVDGDGRLDPLALERSSS